MKDDNDDFFKGEKSKRIKISNELFRKGILDIWVENKPRQISVTYEKWGKIQDPILIPILEFPWATMDQVDKLVNGDGGMSLEDRTYLKSFIINNLGSHWSKLYINGNGNRNGVTPETKDNDKEEKFFSVKEACRLHSTSKCGVKGNIVSASELFKMAIVDGMTCANCGIKSGTKPRNPVHLQMLSRPSKCAGCSEIAVMPEYHYVNATQVELRDLDNYNDMDKLRVLLFDDNTLDILIGDTVKVNGNIDITQTKFGKGKAVSIMFADTITYEGKEDVKLSEQDIQALTKFKDDNAGNLIAKLVEITTPSVIGNELIKEGVLLCAANTVIDKPKKKKRINMLLVGPAGLDKTGFLLGAIELVQGSSFEGAQSSSGLSLTAMVVFEDDTKILSLGPVPRCQGAFCALNEINRMNPKDQGQLLDPMQEGIISLNKYNTNAKIGSSTTILASANPVDEDWQDGIVSLDQINIIPQLLDRFDLKFILKKNQEFESSRKYTELKSLDIVNDDDEDQIAKRRAEVEFLQKYILHAKQYKPKVSEEARHMLNEWFALFEYTNRISKRPFETLYNLAFARAKLKFKDVVDIDDAKETIDFYSKVTEDYNSQVERPLDPRDVAFMKCVEIIQKCESGIAIKELFDMACESNQQIDSYIGQERHMDRNIKIVPIVDMLRNHSHIKVTSKRPIVLQWINP